MAAKAGCVLLLAVLVTAQFGGPAEFETSAVVHQAPAFERGRPVRSPFSGPAEPDDSEQEAPAPGYIEESAQVHASGRAAEMSRLIQRQKHRSQFLATQTVDESAALRVAAKIGVAFLQSALQSVSLLQEDARAGPARRPRDRTRSWRTYGRQIPRGRGHPLFRAPRSRRERGRLPSAVDAGFVGLETATSVRAKSKTRFPRTIMTTLEPVTIEMELGSEAHASQQQNQQAAQGARVETLMQYPPGGAVAPPRFAEVRSGAQAGTAMEALAQNQAQLRAQASEAARNLARAKERLRALTGTKAGSGATAGVSAAAEAQLQAKKPMFSAITEFVKKITGQATPAGKKGKQPKDPRKLEDCCGCRFVWGQVEMDIGSARYVEDVQASFEHNCMDAQKSSIFYPVCEDMYDDMYALTDDYMANKYSVAVMCQRGKFCEQ